VSTSLLDQRSRRRSERGLRCGVGVVAPDELLAQRIVNSLARSDFEVTATERTVDDLVETLGAAGPAIVVLMLGETDAPATVELVRSQFPKTVVAVVLLDADIRVVRELIAAGADAIVLEAELEQGLATAIASGVAGHIVLPGFIRQPLVRPALSAREKQIAGLVVLGLKNGEIAATLHVAETTVKSHMTSILRKLGVRSRSAASARILDPENGLGIGILSIADIDPSLNVFDA
jgi:DNA-binding NarL/FixJ family response regulator